MLPNFIIIGAQKSGTTSLYHYLNQHPEVFMSPIKETHFLDYGDGKRMDGGRGRVPGPPVTSFEQYESLFDGVCGEKAVGEATPTYIYLPDSPGLIRHHMPGAKLVAILRDPVDRAYSAFQHAVRNGKEPLRDFAAALAEEDRRVERNWHPIFHYKTRGFYHAQLTRYGDALEEDRLRVYLYEDLRNDQLGLMRDIFGFLGVDEAFTPDTSTRYNISGVPRNRAVGTLAKRVGGLIPALKRVVPFEARQRIKRRVFVKAPPLDPAIRRSLIHAYHDDIIELQTLLGRDLSAWLKVDK